MWPCQRSLTGVSPTWSSHAPYSGVIDSRRISGFKISFPREHPLALQCKKFATVINLLRAKCVKMTLGWRKVIISEP